MTGLLVISFVVTYIALFWFIAKKTRSRFAQFAVLAIALLIPFWDLPISYVSFGRHCAEDGGIHLESKLLPIDSILIAANSGYGPETALNLGFKTVEYSIDGRIVRFSVIDKKPIKSVHDIPMSKYGYRYSGSIPISWNLSRNEFVVSRIQDGAIVARKTDFSWNGFWWEAKSGIRVTSLHRCPNVSKDELLKLVVSPT